MSLPFPDPPERCQDKELFCLLRELEFTYWHPDHRARARELSEQLQQAALVERMEIALADPAPELRRYAGQFLLSLRRTAAVDVALRLLADHDDFVRECIAMQLYHIAHPDLQRRLVELVRSDPFPGVRGAAARGLAGQDPLVAIPILLEVIDKDHEVGQTGLAPSDIAAHALDEALGTEWLAKRSPDGSCTMPEGPVDLESLKEQALVRLQHLQARRGAGDSQGSS